MLSQYEKDTLKALKGIDGSLKRIAKALENGLKNNEKSAEEPPSNTPSNILAPSKNDGD